jgi:photosystem II stability/assembly factor-like uncharacterized protein
MNPKPVGSDLTDIFYVDNSVGFAVGWNGSVIKTTNSGLNWTALYSNIDTKLYSVFFVDLNTGFAVSGDLDNYKDNYLFKTSNGGQNWYPVSTFTSTHLNQIIFLNANTGFIVGYHLYNYGVIYKTTDKGVS